MSDALTSLFIAAAIGAITYTKMGKRLGYGNGKSIWLVIGVAFMISYIVAFTLLEYVLQIH